MGAVTVVHGAVIEPGHIARAALGRIRMAINHRDRPALRCQRLCRKSARQAGAQDDGFAYC